MSKYVLACVFSEMPLPSGRLFGNYWMTMFDCWPEMLVAGNEFKGNMPMQNFVYNFITAISINHKWCKAWRLIFHYTYFILYTCFYSLTPGDYSFIYWQASTITWNIINSRKQCSLVSNRCAMSIKATAIDLVHLTSTDGISNRHVNYTYCMKHIHVSILISL